MLHSGYDITLEMPRCDGPDTAETSPSPRDGRQFNQLMRHRRLTAGLLSLSTAALFLAGCSGEADAAKNSPEATVTVIVPANVVNTPAESTTTSSTTTEATTATAEAPKGSVESYQVYVDQAPEPSDAIQALGDLYTEFVTSGTFKEGESQESASSVHADDNILKAFFSNVKAQEQNGTIDLWRKRRDVLTRDKALIDGMHISQSLEFATTFSPVGDPTENPDGTVQMETMVSSETNANTFFPNQDFSDSNDNDLIFILRKATNRSGRQVWQVVNMPFASK